jgi:hypothetical protein
MPETVFKNDETILWQAYYLLQDVTEAYLEQEERDVEHQLSFKSEPDKEKFIQQQKENKVEEIINLSNGLCDKNMPFLYIRNNPIITYDNLFYYLLSEVMSLLSTDDYEKYVGLDYPKYLQKKYHWNFSSTTLDNYTDLQQLFGFNRLVRILSNALFIKEHTEETAPVSVETTENIQKLEDYLDKKDKQNDTEYILSIPILDMIYQEFNDELWDNVTFMEFLEIFTSEIKKTDNFKLKPKQVTRFYFLLKKIWLNSSCKSLFGSEKEWVIPFLQNYGLSYSAYTNQFIKKEGGVKHQSFTKSVDKILPKDDDF